MTRTAVPGRRYRHDHGVSWLTVLAEVPQSMAAVTCALHDGGFAGHMARSSGVTRYYLQVPPGDDPETWTDERIWAALDVRMRTGVFGQLEQGPLTERRIVRLRPEVSDPIQHERLFLVGDSASLISPSAAKGANLAIMEAEVPASAVVSALDGDEQPLAAYSHLPCVWRARESSRWMIDLLHPQVDGFHRALLDSLRECRAHQNYFAENYVGI
ncbi:FAD-dependent monooxygenase [Lentzea sp.]|uniref:FAD-dependent monooxygenase n=1 Tax=Lentzea sp. TaxID=56099 RepID=UPI002CAACCBF|nr:FAD-dependent monooxygenase [Lentzea sp.]HUQ59946.1 FAD-dependent monooxygenase [Lentzea sp.]